MATDLHHTRCIVCGRDLEVVRPEFHVDAESGGLRAGQADAKVRRFPDGAIAGACSSHDPETIRTALVLTSGLLGPEEPAPA